MVDIEPVTFVVRIFDDGEGYGQRYKVAFTLQRIGNQAIVAGCAGSLDMGDYREFIRKLKDIGITEVRWMRHGKEVVKEIA